MFNKFRVDTEEAKFLASQPIDAAATLILVKFMGNMNKFNMIKGSPRQVMDRMGITQWEFNHGMRALKKLGFIRKYTKTEYMVNPALMFNGDDQQYYSVRYMWETQTIKSSKGLIA